jgi:hypothetical protein
MSETLTIETNPRTIMAVLHLILLLTSLLLIPPMRITSRAKNLLNIEIIYNDRSTRIFFNELSPVVELPVLGAVDSDSVGIENRGT